MLQLSINYHMPGKYHYQLGQQLKALRKRGVLLIGSGNMVHNLSMAGAPGGKRPTMETADEPYGYGWAIEINETFKKLIREKEHKKLTAYQQLGEAAKLAIPTPDHYYPLLYVLGMQENNDQVEIFNDVCLAGSLSMTSVKIG